MKFLIFNITVAAALIFLFSTDRDKVQDTAGRIHDVATGVKDTAGRVVDKGRRLIERVDSETDDEASNRMDTAQLSKHAILKTTPLDPPVVEPKSADRAPNTVADMPAAAERETKEPEMPPVPVLPAAAPAEVSPERAAVLKRREEILRGIDPEVLIPAAKSKAEPVAPTMPPAERRKQLFALSEEMELFYANSLGQ